MEKYLCVELRYKKIVMTAGAFISPGPALEGGLIISTSILREMSLQKVVVEMCQRFNWVPLVYRKIDGEESHRAAQRYSFAQAYKALTD